ncbi:MAG TPA: transglutaminase family protein, partial [Xanthobacteraceae bacterium]|nr:transglutaminase family protein [Xanthobacteraceae bacterium]
MRIRISHETAYHYAAPARGVIQTLRLTPRNHDSQFVVFWRIDISDDCRLDAHEDAFGNITHTFTVEGALTELSVTVDGEVETQDTHGIVRGAIERFPPSLFLRETALTRPDPAILAFARETRAAAGEDALKLLHRMTERLHREIAFDPDPTHTATTASEAFALRRGVCQDLSHVFISATRSLGVPARYVGGYFHRADGVVRQEAGHAWAEAFVPDIGWVGFDPANGISPTDQHVRVAIGLDYLGAAPVRGARRGGGGEALTVTVHVDQGAGQLQS